MIRNLRRPVIAAIDGVGGSGKSTLATKLTQNLQGTHISLDDFRTEEVYEVDRVRLIDQVLKPLKDLKTAKYKKWLWGQSTFSDWISVDPVGSIVIEGVTALHPELLKFYDVKIWISIDENTAFSRGLQRVSIP